MPSRRDIIAGIGAMTGLAAAGIEPTAAGPNDRVAEAFVYTFPLYEMHRTRQTAVLGLGKASGTARPNAFTHRRTLIDASYRRVTTPNNDTLYSSAWLDLAGGPLVLSVPDTGGRYYSLAFMDMYTNNFAYVGRRETGTRPGRYLIVGPDWKGTGTGGMPVIKSPTCAVWLLGRILVDGPDDLPAVHAIQDALRLESARGDSGGAMAGSAMDERPPPANPGDAAAYFALVNRLLALYPPPARDAGLLQSWRPAGIGPGLTPDPGTLAAGFEAGRQRVYDRSAPLGRTVDGWQYPPLSLGDFGTDFLLRARVALVGLAALSPAEAYYLMGNVDRGGAPLTGGRAYVLRFQSGRLPPVDAFWSLTMYEVQSDGRAYFVDHPSQRYALGDRSRGLERDPDGGLTLYLQPDPPAEPKRRANWLPAPAAGRMRLALRFYQPRAEILDGRWRAPPIEPAG